MLHMKKQKFFTFGKYVEETLLVRNTTKRLKMWHTKITHATKKDSFLGKNYLKLFFERLMIAVRIRKVF